MVGSLVTLYNIQIEHVFRACTLDLRSTYNRIYSDSFTERCGFISIHDVTMNVSFNHKLELGSCGQ